jgi:hypothetical protein
MFSIMWSTVQLLMSNFFITINDLRFKWLGFLRWFSALYYSCVFMVSSVVCGAGRGMAVTAFVSHLHLKTLPRTQTNKNQKHSFEGLARVEFGGAQFDCSAGVDPAGVTFLKQLMPNSKMLGLSAVTNALVNPGPDCVADTDALLRYYQFYRPFKATAGALLAYYLAVHVATYAAMVIVVRKERR